MFEKNAEALLNPHFLFNSMNAIRYMIFEDQQVASDLLSDLAELIRYQLADGKTNTSLENDLTQLASLIRLEQLRLEERLEVTSNFEILAQPVRFQKSLLLPLVEYIFVEKDIYSVQHNQLSLTCSQQGASTVFILELTQTPKIKAGELNLDRFIQNAALQQEVKLVQSVNTNTYKMELIISNEC